MTNDIVYVQGVLTKQVLADLKRIAKTTSTKDALTYAVEKVLENERAKKVKP